MTTKLYTSNHLKRRCTVLNVADIGTLTSAWQDGTKRMYHASVHNKRSFVHLSTDKDDLFSILTSFIANLGLLQNGTKHISFTFTPCAKEKEVNVWFHTIYMIPCDFWGKAHLHDFHDLHDTTCQNWAETQCVNLCIECAMNEIGTLDQISE